MTRAQIMGIIAAILGVVTCASILLHWNIAASAIFAIATGLAGVFAGWRRE